MRLRNWAAEGHPAAKPLQDLEGFEWDCHVEQTLDPGLLCLFKITGFHWYFKVGIARRFR